ncbi:cholinesterase, partial [Aplysia californica]|uniref:Carboxylic ester hydrolase n=1 Tax=Aplysia californica TaxID=6500 RepID=A0ABM1A227_APLCA
MTTLRSTLLVSLCLTCAHLLDPASGQQQQVVSAPSGSYMGSTLTAFNGMEYLAYRGIPYAEPPTGDLRFRKPVAKTPLSGVYNATEFKPFCLQFRPGLFGQGVEDCLYLNVYTPTSDPRRKPRKVFVFVHGGGNQNGFSDLYVPGSLVSWFDLVVVTFNYRLGFLGFLSTQTPACLGNFGLWDQITALRWVKDNIASFGGDPDAVTVGGESAGSIDISVLALSSHASDLFHRVFAMSGFIGVASGANINPDPVPLTLALARREGCLAVNTSDPVSDADWSPVITCLQKVPLERLTTTAGLGAATTTGPVVDGDILVKDLPSLFADVQYMNSTGVKDKDFLVTLVENEGALFQTFIDASLARMSPAQVNALPANTFLRNLMEPYLVPLSPGGNVDPRVLDKVVNYYVQEQVFTPVSDVTSDQIFYLPALEYFTALYNSRPRGDGKVFFLQFVHYPAFAAGPYKGMVHVSDLCYLFDLDPTIANQVIDYKLNGTLWAHVDDMLKIKYSRMASVFIKRGNPNKGVSGDIICDWPTFDPEEAHYLQFSEYSEVKKYFREERKR